jgi:Kef-type K+ transport system membrane component KefB
MLIRLCAFFIMLALAWITQFYPYGSNSASRTVIALGFVILAGYLLGEILVKIRLPRVSGYLFAGMLFGPYIGGILTIQTVHDLALIDTIALSLIALSAGGELHLSSLKKGWKGILGIMFAQVVGILPMAGLFFYFMATTFHFMGDIPQTSLISAAMVFGVIAISQSPSITIAIITETRSSGFATDTVLSVSVIIDVLVISLFTIVMTLIGLLEQGQSDIEWGVYLALGAELVFSILAGILAGIGISIYLKYVNANRVLFVLAFSYLVSVTCKPLHLDPILVCVFAGTWVTNASKKGHELIEMIEKGSLIIYVIFFCVAGAALNLTALVEMKWIALALVVARMAFLAITTWSGVKISGIPIPTTGSFWMAFMPQAGVSLGLIAILNKKGFAWAPTMYTLMLACIALNQIIGPITLKYALQKTGETQETN